MPHDPWIEHKWNSSRQELRSWAHKNPKTKRKIQNNNSTDNNNEKIGHRNQNFFSEHKTLFGYWEKNLQEKEKNLSFRESY